MKDEIIKAAKRASVLLLDMQSDDLPTIPKSVLYAIQDELECAASCGDIGLIEYSTKSMQTWIPSFEIDIPNKSEEYKNIFNTLHLKVFGEEPNYFVDEPEANLDGVPVHHEPVNENMEYQDVPIADESEVSDEEESTDSTVQPALVANGSSQFSNGFIAMNQQKPKVKPFDVPGNIGAFLGQLEQDKLAIALHGAQGCGKTQFVLQALDAFTNAGKRCGCFFLETGINNNLMDKYVERNVSPENAGKIGMAGSGNLEAVKKASKDFDVIAIDSWQSLDEDSGEFNKLREQYPNTIYIIIFQQTSNKTIRGGTKPLFDSSIVIEGFKPNDNFNDNHFVCTKNRYGNTGARYYPASKSLQMN